MVKAEGSASLGRPAGSDGQQTERRLFQVAAQLFAARGYFGVGIREIASECGFTMSSIYHYVKSKEELLERLMQRALGEFTRHARSAIESSDDPVEQLARLVEMNVIFHAVNPRTAQVVDREVDALGPEARNRVIQIRDEYERLWTDVLESGIRRESFRFGHLPSARFALLGMCSEIAYWYSPRGELSIAQLRDNFVDMALALVSGQSMARPPYLIDHSDYSLFSIEGSAG